MEARQNRWVRILRVIVARPVNAMYRVCNRYVKVGRQRRRLPTAIEIW
jgi:hypothetical protein